MLVLRSCLFSQPVRSFCKSNLRLDRYSRDGLRSRIQRQNLKELAKQVEQKTNPTGPTILPYQSDLIPVRPLKDLWKALGFTIGAGGAVFTIAIITDLERARKKLRGMYENATNFITSFQRLDTAQGKTTWKDLSEGDKACAALVGLNILVFALWKIKPLQPQMWRYFTNSYASRSLCAPMALSVFSHSSVIHLGLNMYVMWTFANVAIDQFFGPDQFWAMYLTSGIASSFVSLVHKGIIRSPVRALGASGAILGLLAYTCMKIPEARLKIVFVPNFDFSAQSAIIGILLFDLAGLILKFRLFDHAAHLGGTLFGIFYALYGEQLIWGKYGSMVEQSYKSLRGDTT